MVNIRILKMGVLLAILLVGVVGCGANETTATGSVKLQSIQEQYKADFEVTPAVPGVNTYKVTITDGKNQISSGKEAVLKFEMPNMKHGKSEKVLTLKKDGTWEAEGPHIMMPGSWQATLHWTDNEEQAHVFTYNFEIEN